MTEEQRKKLRSDPNFKALSSGYKTEYTPAVNSVDNETANLEAIMNANKSKTLSPEKAIADKKAQDPMRQGVFGKALGTGFDVLKGAVKGVGSTIVGMGELGTKLNPLISKDDKQKTSNFAEGLRENQLKARGTAENVGKFGEQVAEFLIPSTSAIKAGKFMSGLVGGGKAVKGLAGLGTTAFGEGLLSAGQTALQEGEVNKKVVTAGLTGLAIPPALKVGGKILKGVGTVGSEVLGKTTGAGKQAIVEAFNNPEVIKLAKKAGADMPTFQDDMLSSLKSGLEEIKQTRGNAYKSSLEKIKLDPKEYDNVISDVRNIAKNGLDEFNLTIKPQSDEVTGKVLNNIDFSKSTMRVNESEKRVVQEAYNDLMSWTDDSAAGLDNLKKTMFAWKDKLPLEAKEGKVLISKLANGLDKTIKQNVKGYKEMTGGYAQASNMIDEIENAFKPGGNKETAIKKIMTSLRENNEARKELLDLVGGRELIDKVAGSQLASWTPKGLTGAITGGGAGAGGALMILNPHAWPALLSLAATTSPRLMGKLATVLGKIDRKMLETGIPLVIANELRAIIQELYSE